MIRANEQTWLCLLLLVSLSLLTESEAQPPAPAIDRIEEDWSLVVGTPNPLEVGPQITTTMSPLGDNSQLYFIFNMNFRNDPFRPGGLQVQCFDQEQAAGEATSSKSALLQTQGEAVRWTQRLECVDGQLRYSIIAGASQTWGQFGDTDDLRIELPAGVGTLSAYDPEQSRLHSGPTWQSTQMTLLGVHYYSEDELVASDPTPRPITPP